MADVFIAVGILILIVSVIDRIAQKRKKRSDEDIEQSDTD